MNLRFDGQRALVTGAGKGIGREIATLLTSLGAEVIALSRTEQDLQSLHTEVNTITVVSDVHDVANTVQAIEQLGDIHLLVNNAGISIPQSFLDTSIEDFDRTMAVNVRATLAISQVVARNMIQRSNGGAIVNVSSQASQVGIADHAAYCASKGALDQLTRVMALELGPHQIRVNAVNPTVTLTPMGRMAWGDPEKRDPMLAKIPLGRFAKPRDIANAVAFLLSDEANMITGVTLPVDGGFLAL